MRPYQEDRFFSLIAEQGLCFGVFDGHGDHQCSHFLAEEFPVILMKAIEDLEDEGKNDPELWLKEAFSRANVSTHYMGSGSTASVVFLPLSGKEVTVAVLGDSPVIVRKEDGNIWVAPEHNVRTNPKELEAARQRGALVDNHGNYIYANFRSPGLQMARAFGDSELAQVLSRVPDVETLKLGNKSWVLVATDGALDPSHRDPEAGVKALSDMLNAGADAQDIVNRAEKIPTGDNVTAMVVRIARTRKA